MTTKASTAVDAERVVAVERVARRRRRRAGRGARPRVPVSTSVCRNRSISPLAAPPRPGRTQPDEVGGAGAQLPGGAVGGVAELLDRGWTRSRVSGRSSSGLFSALDTVCRDTPAASATVASVATGHGVVPASWSVSPQVLWIVPSLAHGRRGSRASTIPRGVRRASGSAGPSRRGRRTVGAPPSVLAMSRTPARPARPTTAASAAGQTAKWLGRCGECQAWGSRRRDGGAAAARRRRRRPGHRSGASRSGRCRSRTPCRAPAASPELDRVLGGGLVPGAAVLLAGEPGVGKSTLLLEVAAADRAQRQRARSTSPARSPRPRCGCAPTGPARSTTTSTSRPRPTSAPCSATSRRSARRCSSSTRCRRSAPSASTASRAA